MSELKDIPPLSDVELWGVYDKERGILVRGHKKDFYYAKAACKVAIGHMVRYLDSPSVEWLESHRELYKKDYKAYYREFKAEEKRIADLYKERYIPVKITAVEYPEQ